MFFNIAHVGEYHYQYQYHYHYFLLFLFVSEPLIFIEYECTLLRKMESVVVDTITMSLLWKKHVEVSSEK